MSPFNCWFPLPLLRIDEDSNIVFDGAGFLTAITDPTDRHRIFAVIYADIVYQMAYVETFFWENNVPGFPVTFEFSDRVVTDLENYPFRETLIDIYANFFHYPGRWVYSLSVGGGYIRKAIEDIGTSAYEWNETANLFYYSASVVLSNIKRRPHELFGTGFRLSFRGANIIDDFQPRFEGTFRAAIETRFPLNVIFYGAYDDRGMNIHGASPNFTRALFINYASVEYSINAGPRNLLWLCGAEASLGLFSFEIQRNLSHIYFNRFFGTLSVRNVLYDSDDYPNAEGIQIGDLHLAQSLVFKIGLGSSILPIKHFPIYLEPNVWIAWKFSNTITGKEDVWNYNIGFDLRY